ncbi:uncharacterized protein Hap1MRO34_022307 [Clarias gariepinus]
MIEEIFASAEVTKNNEADSSDRGNSYEDKFPLGTLDKLNQDKLEPQSPRSFRKSKSSGGDTAWSKCYRVTVVCVVLLCVLLLTAVTLLWIKYNILKTEIIQLKTSNNNLTIERDQLQTSNNNLTIERDQLQTSNNNLTIERDQLQTSYSNLTRERVEVQRDRDKFPRTLVDLNKASCFNSKLYVMSNEKKNWTESRQDCMNKGADLVIINSAEEQDFITEQLQGGHAWIGLSDRDTEKVWKWVDGTPVTPGFSKWGPNQPDNQKGDEDCGMTGYPDEQHWNDSPCSLKLFWICEKRT